MGQRAETLDEDIDDAADVVGPALVTVLGTCISSELVALVVIVGSHDPDAIVGARRDGNFGGEVDGAGQHETVVVVGVLADQVDTTRCADDVGGRGVQFLLQQGGCVLDGVGGGLAGAHDRKEVGCGGFMPGVSGACRDEPVASCGVLVMKTSGNVARHARGRPASLTGRLAWQGRREKVSGRLPRGNGPRAGRAAARPPVRR